MRAVGSVGDVGGIVVDQNWAVVGKGQVIMLKVELIKVLNSRESGE